MTTTPYLSFEPKVALGLLALLLAVMGGGADASSGNVEPVERPVQHPGVRVAPRLLEVSNLINAPQARAEFGVSGQGLAVAVVDSGLRTSHVDFTDRVLTQKNFTSGNGGNESNAFDDHGHGTNVAGIIAANGIHTGIAPGVGVIPLKVLDAHGGGSFDSIRNALEWVCANRTRYNISVVNMSLGDGCNHTEKTADSLAGLIQNLRAVGVAVVVAAGNAYYPCQSRQGMGYPAIFPETVSVGAVYDSDRGGFAYGNGAQAYTTGADRLTPFSQRLHETVHALAHTDIFAPGAPVTSSGHLSDQGSSTQSGTSQATPVTAGVILLIQELYMRRHGVLPSIDLIEATLRSSGRVITDGDDEDDNVSHSGLSYRRIDALAALRSLADQTPDSGPPTIASQPRSQTVAEGSRATFSVLAGGAAPLQFQWQRDGVNIPGATASVYETDGAIMIDNGARFTCTLTNAEGSIVTQVATLTVTSSGLIQLQNGQGESGSAGDGAWCHYYIRVPSDATELKFRTYGTSDDLDLYVRRIQRPSESEWDFRPYSVSGDEEIRVDGSTSPTISGGIWFCAVYGYKGSPFTLTATHNGACRSPGSIIQSGPTASPNPALAGERIVFSVSATDAAGSGLGYFWSFGDGTQATGATVNHAYASSGTYIATVTITDFDFFVTADVTVNVDARPEPMDVTRLRIKLNFKTDGRDACTMRAGLALPEDFNPAGATAVLKIGEARFAFTLDSKGRARNAHGKLTLKTRGRQGLAISLRNGSWGRLWAPQGMANEEARNVTITMPVRLTLSAGAIGETVYAAEKNLRYSARAGRSGIAR